MYCMLSNYALVGGVLEAYSSLFVCVCVCVCVCVSVCLCMSITRISQRLLPARHWWVQCGHIVTISQSYLISVFWFKALLSSYSLICLPWCLLWEIQNQEKTKLFTAGCFSTRQSRLYHRPGSNMSETRKWDCRRLATLPVHSSVAAKSLGSVALLWTLASPRGYQVLSYCKFCQIPCCDLDSLAYCYCWLCLYLLECQQSILTWSC